MNLSTKQASTRIYKRILFIILIVTTVYFYPTLSAPVEEKLISHDNYLYNFNKQLTPYTLSRHYRSICPQGYEFIPGICNKKRPNYNHHWPGYPHYNSHYHEHRHPPPPPPYYQGHSHHYPEDYYRYH